MTNERLKDARARIEFTKWLEGNPERPDTPEEAQRIKDAMSADSDGDSRAVFAHWAETAFADPELPVSHPAYQPKERN